MLFRQEEVMIPLPSRTGIVLHTIISTPAEANPHPALLLLHFWGGSNRTLTPLISQLQEKFSIVAPSLRGWGRSSKPENAESYNITDYVDDIANLISYWIYQRPELLRNGLVVVGHSMGGKIAQVLLTKSEVVNMLKGLVLFAPAPAGSLQLPTAEMREQQIHASNSEDSARFVVQNVLLGHPDAVGLEEVAQLATDAFEGSEAAKKAWPDYGMGEDHQSTVTDVVRGLPSGKTLKVTVVGGSLDRVETPERVQNEVVKLLEDAGANVTSNVLEGVGHLVPIEAPKALAESILSFVEDTHIVLT